MQAPEDVQAMLKLASLDVYGGKLVSAQALPGAGSSTTWATPKRPARRNSPSSQMHWRGR
jgi:hypothetical protein